MGYKLPRELLSQIYSRVLCISGRMGPYPADSRTWQCSLSDTSFSDMIDGKVKESRRLESKSPKPLRTGSVWQSDSLH